MTSECSAPPEQAVILCGEQGVLLPCLLGELSRRGFCRVLMVVDDPGPAADLARSASNSFGLEVSVIVGTGSGGTAGALRQAAASLEPDFLLLDGASWFDFNWLDLCLRGAGQPSAVGAVALRRPGGAPAGVLMIRRDALLPHLPRTGSVEQDVLPRLVAEARIAAVEYAGLFVEAAAPGAQAAVRAGRRRAAVFLDRDGVLNEDLGYVGTPERFHWCPEAVKSVKRLNDAGRYVFVVTNQAGVARGHYPEASVEALHRHMQAQLRRHGARIDDFRYCPFLEEGSVAAYAKPSHWRKPEPGMILDLFAMWDIDRGGSILAGDRDSDLKAAAAAGIPGHLVGPEGLTLAFVDRLLVPRPSQNAGSERPVLNG